MKTLATTKRRMLGMLAICFCAVLTFYFLPRTEAERASKPLAPSITVANAVDDVAGTDDGNADPGDTLEYTVTVTNGAAVGAGNDAAGLILSDTLDSNLTLVAGSVNASPIAGNDSYDTVGNTQLQVAASQSVLPAIFVNGNVLSNDSDPGGSAPTAVALTNAATTSGGLVTLQTNGTFVYTPPLNFTGTDTFNYQATDGTANGTGTVSINVIGTVRYVKNDAVAGGDGRSNTPFNTLAGGQSATAGVTIYVFAGNGTTGNQSTGITLANNQRLIGSGVALTMPGITVNGVSNPTVIGAGTQPQITNTNAGGNGVSVGTSTGVEIQGLNIGGTSNSIDATFSGAATGSLTIANNTINGAGQEGVDINGGSTGTIAVAMNSNVVTATGTGIDITRTAGTVAVTSFFNNVISGNTLAAGIAMNSVVFDSNTVTAGFQTVSAGTLAVGASGNGVATSGMTLTSVTGDLSFTDLDIFADNGNALAITSSGTFSAGGTGFRIVVSNTTVATLVAINGSAADISNATVDLQLAQLSSTNSTVTGVNLNTVGGTFTAPSGSAISNAAGIDFSISGATGPTVTYGGTITDDVGQLVNITGQNGGTKSFTGAVTDNFDGDGTEQGISLTGNTGATISFSGGLSVRTTTNAAFTASGGGTVSVCDENPCNPAATGALVNRLQSTTGAALNVANTTIGANKLEFQSISSTGAASGIILNNTGSSGGLTVSGTATGNDRCGGAVTVNALGTAATITPPTTAECTGGTIQNSTGDGISLTSTSNVSLNRMYVLNNNNNGVYGNNVTNFSFVKSFASNNDNANTLALAAGLRFDNILGSSAFTNSAISGTKGDNIRIDNTSGTLTNLAIAGTTIGPNPVGTGANGIALLTHNASAATVTVTNSAFSGNAASGFLTTIADTSNGTVNISTTTFQDNNINIDMGSDTGMTGTGAHAFDIHDNTVLRSKSNSINIVGDGVINGKINNNRIGNGAIDSGSRDAYDIAASQRGNPAWRLSITNNVLRNSDFEGLFVRIGDLLSGDTGNLNLTITGNTIFAPDDNSGFPAFPRGMMIRSRQATSLCVNLANNESQGTGGGEGYRLQRSDTSQYRMQGFVTNALATTTGNNNKTGGAAPTVSAAGEPFQGGCTAQVPPLADESELEISQSNAENNFGIFSSIYRTPSEAVVWPAPTLRYPADAKIVSKQLVAEAGGEIVSGLSEDLKIDADYLKTAQTFFAGVSDQMREAFNKLGAVISPTVAAQGKKEETPAELSGETITVGSPSGFTLPAQKSVTIKFRATVNNGPYASGLANINNTANVTNGGTINVNSNVASIALDAAPDLQVTVSDGNTTTQPAGVVQYTTTYQNNTATNGQNAGAVRVSQTVPVNTTFNATVSGPGWSCPDGSPATTICTFDVGPVNAGATPAALNFAVNVLGLLPSGAVNIGDTATIAENPLNANGNDRVPGNNASSDLTNIIGNWDGSNSADWNLPQNWSNDVVPPAGNSISIPLAGNQPQVISTDVTVNLLSLGRSLTIGSGRTVTATGNVDLGANVVDGLGMLELGSASQISRTSGQVNSTLKKNFAGPGPLFVMPVGTTGAYSPMNVTVTSGSGQLTARTNVGVPGAIIVNSARTLQRYWTLSGAGIRSNITFNYLNGDVPVAPNNENIWTIIRVTGTTAIRYPLSNPDVIMNAAANTFTINNLESYSDWTAGEPLAPTAADATVTGRVLDSTGRGVSGAQVSIQDQTGNIRWTTTNPFGYYRFLNVQVGSVYLIAPRDKRFTYEPRTVSVSDDVTGLDFTP